MKFEKSFEKLVTTITNREFNYTALLSAAELYLQNLWNRWGITILTWVALFLCSVGEELIKVLAILYVIGSNLLPPVLALLVAYALSNFVIKSQKKASDPTNVNLFDRGLALMGLVLPCAEFARYFPQEIKSIPILHQLQVEYLTGLIMFLNLNQIIVLFVQVFCFRELIRRRGPDTEWSGSTGKKVWIKYFIRYYWCYGFCLTTMLEPYNFMQIKLITLLDLPRWVNLCISQGAFYISGALLIHAIIHALIGVPNRMPLFHGACEFHVGRPKKS
jgi:hypothetical protein